MNKKILIIGNSANAYSLAKKLSADNEIFVIPESDSLKEFATCIDIRENSINEILEFVMENDIDLTIPISIESINSNIVEVFQKNNLPIFGPTKTSSEGLFNKLLAKKLLYKLRIPTPKFGIFEKENMALDYVKNTKSPFVIKTKNNSDTVILTSKNIAKNIINTIFLQKGEKVLIEDYIQGTSFNFYIITDGYKALPLNSSIVYKHSLEGNGGQLTNGMGACSPNYKLSTENEYFLMDNVVYPIIEYLESNGTPYLGILGISGILTEQGKLEILEILPFMENSDSAGVLELIDTNLLHVLFACINATFSDDYEYIPQKDFYATTLVLNCKNRDNTKENPINNIDGLDEDTIIGFYPQTKKNKYLEFEANNGPVINLTSVGRTVASATEKAYKEAEEISFNGLSYRRDICKNLNMNY